jgi:hypothetical protein
LDRLASPNVLCGGSSLEGADFELAIPPRKHLDLSQCIPNGSHDPCSTSLFIESSPTPSIPNDANVFTPRQQCSSQAWNHSPSLSGPYMLQSLSTTSSPASFSNNSSPRHSSSSPQLGYTCTLCPDLALPSIDALIYHIQIQHRPANPDLSRPLQCVCRSKARFKRRRDFERHLRTTHEHGARVFRCCCGSGFTRRDKFLEHVRGSCTSSFPYQCQCGTITEDIIDHLKSCGRKKLGRPPKMMKTPNMSQESQE